MKKQTNQNPCFTKKRIFRGEVHKLSTLEAIRVIKQKLNPSQLKRFESSCFGKLFQMSTSIKLSGQIIHHLLSRQVNHPNQDEMWFLIGNKRARFSKDEFALVTGLNCGQKYPSRTGFDAGTRLVDKYFLGQNFITKKCLKQRLLSCDDDDVFKLSLVYFLQALLLTRAGEASVDRYWLMLAEDLESFNEFPWGNLCFERTLFSMKKIAKENFGVESASEDYTLRGFPFAFQIWAYEAIPLLGSKFAEKSSRNLIPRILCWESTQEATYDELRESVFGVKNLRVLKKLRATELEREQDYMKAITESSLELEKHDCDNHDDTESTRMESMKMTTTKKGKKHSKQKDMDAKLISPCFTKNRIFRGKVHNLSTLGAIRVIKGKLNPSQLERFESSCFGKLFGMSTKIKFSSQIVHHLLSRRVDHPEEEDEMWFLIGRERARFSLNEFALVTGLNCGRKYPSRTEPDGTGTTTRLVDKYFGGRKYIFTRCLKEQFICCEDEEDSYRLSLVYFLQALLLARDDKASIDKQWLSLVDDLESFDEFPWGKLCYERTLLSLKERAREKYEENGSEKDMVEPMKTNYRLCGFPYAFQIWAYEAIPRLGRKFAEKSSRNSIPRILCWEHTQTPTFKELNHNVFGIKNLRVLKTLRATELEREQDYMKAIAKSSLTLEENDSAESMGSCLELGEESYDHDDDNDDISWGRGKGKRKRRTKKNNVTFPFKKCSKKKKLVTGANVNLNPKVNVNLNPNHRRAIMEIGQPLQKNSNCNLQTSVQECLRRDIAFIGNGDRAQHSNGSRIDLDAFVCGGSRYNKPIPIYILKHLDAILQHELNLDFAHDFRQSTTLLYRSVAEIEIVMLSDDD